MDHQEIQKLIKSKAEDIQTFGYFLCGNSIEALNLVETVLKQFVTKFDELPSEEETAFSLFQITLKHCRQKNQLENAPIEQKEPLKKSILIQLTKDSRKLNGTPFFQRLMTKTILELPFDLKVPLLLRDTFQMSYKEIAILLNTPETTVGYRLAQARGALLNALRCEKPITFH